MVVLATNINIIHTTSITTTGRVNASFSKRCRSSSLEGHDIMKLLKILTLISMIPIAYAADNQCVTPQLMVTCANKLNQVYLELNNYKYSAESLPHHLRYLDDYKIIASSQFNESQFVNAIHNKPKVIDVDLRAEYHGFNNGVPFSFIALPNDDINADKLQSVIIPQEEYILHKVLNSYKSIQFYRYNLKSIPDENTPTICLNTSIQSESQLMAKYLQSYYRITVTDHLAMSAENIDQLLNLYDTYLKSNPQQWVYLHCQGGDGRTTTATIMLMMLKQKDAGKLEPLPALIDKVQKASSYQLMPNCSESDLSYRCQGKWQRYKTIAKFYQFVQQRKGLQKYSDWQSSVK